MNKLPYIFTLVALAVFAISCTTDPNAPGVEYMPDMYRSPALEAYTDYGTNETMDWTQERKDELGQKPVLSMKPPHGTVAWTGNADNAWMNIPYPLGNTVEEYERSAMEIVSPPTIKMNKENIEKGREIYTRMCVHCHGETGKGDGTIAARGKISGIPDYSTKLKDLPEGKMFHTLTHGKGLMGSHASQINQKERWQVIQWVKCLQRGITEPTYNDAGELIINIENAPADSAGTQP